MARSPVAGDAKAKADNNGSGLDRRPCPVVRTHSVVFPLLGCYTTAAAVLSENPTMTTMRSDDDEDWAKPRMTDEEVVA